MLKGRPPHREDANSFCLFVNRNRCRRHLKPLAVSNASLRDISHMTAMRKVERATGWSWFVDLMPLDNNEFPIVLASGVYAATPGSPAGLRIPRERDRVLPKL